MYLVISACAAIGFVIAYNIYKKKTAKKPLFCPMKFHCDPVVHSEYSSLFHIPLEYWGMIYYGIVFLSYMSFVFLPDITIHKFFVLTTIIATGFAYLFSMYLTGIQAFILKQWCSWCLMSAILCTIIFFSVIQASVFDMMPYIKNYRLLITGLHLFGIILGFGGTIITDILFIKFLKDSRISKDEANILHFLSQIIWFGLGVIVISGTLLFVSDIERYSHSVKFLVKMLIVAIVIFNGFILNMIVAPKLIQIPFGEFLTSYDVKLRNFRRLVFALGAVSVISWYSTFVLGLLRSSPFPFEVIFSIYITLLAVAIVVSQFLEVFIARVKSPSVPQAKSTS